MTSHEWVEIPGDGADDSDPALAMVTCRLCGSLVVADRTSPRGTWWAGWPGVFADCDLTRVGQVLLK